MKFKELAQMKKEERDKKLKELELELIKLNSQVATGTPPKNAGQLKRLKKDIAKIMLLKSIDEKRLAQQIQQKEQKPQPAEATKPLDQKPSKKPSKKINKKINEKTK